MRFRHAALCLELRSRRFACDLIIYVLPFWDPPRLTRRQTPSILLILQSCLIGIDNRVPKVVSNEPVILLSNLNPPGHPPFPLFHQTQVQKGKAKVNHFNIHAMQTASIHTDDHIDAHAFLTLRHPSGVQRPSVIYSQAVVRPQLVDDGLPTT